jgi:hypothetical protein
MKSSEVVRVLEKAHMESKISSILKVCPFWAELRADSCGTK